MQQLPGTVRKPAAKKRHVIDRERMGVDYGAGLLSLREIAAKHGCSASRVVQIADEEGWKRDVREKARQLSAALANAPQPDPGLLPGAIAATASPAATVERPTPRSAIAAEVDETAKAMAFIRREHRDVIRKARGNLSRLLQEVQEANQGPLFMELFERAIDEASALEPEDSASDCAKRELAEKQLRHLKTAAEKLLTLPSRVYGLHKLSIAAKNLIYLERQAFDLDAPDDGKPPPPRDTSMSPAEIYAWLAGQKPT